VISSLDSIVNVSPRIPFLQITKTSTSTQANSETIKAKWRTKKILLGASRTEGTAAAAQVSANEDSNRAVEVILKGKESELKQYTIRYQESKRKYSALVARLKAHFISQAFEALQSSAKEELAKSGLPLPASYQTAEEHLCNLLATLVLDTT